MGSERVNSSTVLQCPLVQRRFQKSVVRKLDRIIVERLRVREILRKTRVNHENVQENST